eukprot:9477058-Pyramimonas_sp.AAC.1
MHSDGAISVTAYLFRRLSFSLRRWPPIELFFRDTPCHRAILGTCDGLRHAPRVRTNAYERHILGHSGPAVVCLLGPFGASGA